MQPWDQTSRWYQQGPPPQTQQGYLLPHQQQGYPPPPQQQQGYPSLQPQPGYPPQPQQAYAGGSPPHQPSFQYPGWAQPPPPAPQQYPHQGYYAYYGPPTTSPASSSTAPPLSPPAQDDGWYIAMQLYEALQDVGLPHLYPLLLHHGYSSLHTVVMLNLHQLAAMGIPRHEAQHLISAFRSPLTPSEPLAQASFQGQPSVPPPSNEQEPADPPPVRVKRKYVRKPAPDPNAPEKPVTAYLTFQQEVRADLRSRGLISHVTFSDIARMSGERWSQMPHAEKSAREQAAAKAKRDFQSALEAYQHTEAYRTYQAYLKSFNEQEAAKAERRGG